MKIISPITKVIYHYKPLQTYMQLLRAITVEGLKTIYTVISYCLHIVSFGLLRAQTKTYTRAQFKRNILFLDFLVGKLANFPETSLPGIGGMSTCNNRPS